MLLLNTLPSILSNIKFVNFAFLESAVIKNE